MSFIIQFYTRVVRDPFECVNFSCGIMSMIDVKSSEHVLLLTHGLLLDLVVKCW